MSAPPKVAGVKCAHEALSRRAKDREKHPLSVFSDTYWKVPESGKLEFKDSFLGHRQFSPITNCRHTVVATNLFRVFSWFVQLIRELILHRLNCRRPSLFSAYLVCSLETSASSPIAACLRTVAGDARCLLRAGLGHLLISRPLSLRVFSPSPLVPPGLIVGWADAERTRSIY